jgi:hypothetical protein
MINTLMKKLLGHTAYVSLMTVSAALLGLTDTFVLPWHYAFGNAGGPATVVMLVLTGGALAVHFAWDHFHSSDIEQTELTPLFMGYYFAMIASTVALADVRGFIFCGMLLSCYIAGAISAERKNYRWCLEHKLAW